MPRTSHSGNPRSFYSAGSVIDKWGDLVWVLESEEFIFQGKIQRTTSWMRMQSFNFLNANLKRNLLLVATLKHQ